MIRKFLFYHVAKEDISDVPSCSFEYIPPQRSDNHIDRFYATDTERKRVPIVRYTVWTGKYKNGVDLITGGREKEYEEIYVAVSEELEEILRYYKITHEQQTVELNLKHKADKLAAIQNSKQETTDYILSDFACSSIWRRLRMAFTGDLSGCTN